MKHNLNRSPETGLWRNQLTIDLHYYEDVIVINVLTNYLERVRDLKDGEDPHYMENSLMEVLEYFGYSIEESNFGRD